MVTSLKQNRLILTGIAAFISAIIMIDAPNEIANAWLIGSVGFMLYRILKSDKMQTSLLPATADLMIWLLIISVMIVCMHFEELMTARELVVATDQKKGVPDLFFRCISVMIEGERPVSLCLVIMAPILRIVFASYGGVKRFPWLNPLFAGTIGLAFLLARWSNGSLSDFLFRNNGRAIVVAYVLYWLLVILITQTVAMVSHNEKSSEIQIITYVLLALTLILNIGCVKYYSENGEAIRDFLLTMPSVVFTWPKTIVVSVLLIALVIYLRGPHVLDATLGADAYVAGATASILLILKLLMQFYFVHSWIVFLLYVHLLFFGLRNDLSGKRTYIFTSGAFLCAVTVVMAVIVKLLHDGYATNTLALLGFISLVLRQRNGSSILLTDRTRLSFVYETLVFIGIEALLFLPYAGFTFSLLRAVACVCLLALSLVFVLDRYSCGEIDFPFSLSLAVCLAAALMCFLLVRPSMQIDAVRSADKPANTVVTITHSEESALVSTTYEWKDCFGRLVEDDKGKGALKTKNGVGGLKVRGDILTVVVEADDGVIVRRTFFYPYWLYDFGQKTL